MGFTTFYNLLRYSNMSDICSKCGQPKTANQSGRLTQWVNVCICDIADEAQEISVKMCATCGKRINEGRKGSITQYVFRSDTCKCDKPKPLERSGDFYHQAQAFEGFVDSGEDEVELEVEADKFPLDRYKPVQKLGKGASGYVYLARDRLLGKKVAVKTLHYLSSEQLIAFQNEAKATSLLNHPNIVQILDFGVTESGTPYMVLEYISGISLRSKLFREKKLSWQSTVDIFFEIAKALEYSHNEGIMHRDLKPSNILVFEDKSGKTAVKVIDFGIAQVEQAGQDEFDSQGNTIVGTPNYMSPDQAKGQPYSSQSEVYSLGCVLFECLTGMPPFSAETSLELIRKHAEEEVPDLSSLVEGDLPYVLDKFVSRCLNKNPDERFQSMTELRTSLSSIYEVVEESKRAEQEKLEKVESDTKKKSGAGKIIVLGFVFLAGLGILSTSLYSHLDKKNVDDLKVKETKKALIEEKKKDFSDGLTNILDGPRLSRNNTLLLYQYGDVQASDLKKLDLSNVRIVEFDFCSILDDETFEIVGGMPRIERFVIPGASGVTQERLKILAQAYKNNDSKFKKLFTLDLIKTDVPAGSLKVITPLRDLTSLELDNTKVNDEDMKAISGMNLLFVAIEGTKVTNKGFKELSKIKSLITVCIDKTDIDKAAIANFQKQLPKCKVKKWKNIRSSRMSY